MTANNRMRKSKTRSIIQFTISIGIFVVLIATAIFLRTQSTYFQSDARGGSQSANGRFGVALGTWDYSRLGCFDAQGEKIDCAADPYKLYAAGMNDMLITTYDAQQQRLSNAAFNVSSMSHQDPSANTQFIWFRYEDLDNPQVINEGRFSYTNQAEYTASRLGRRMTDEEITSPTQRSGQSGADIYATSNVPGSVRVRVQREQVTNVHGRSSSWRIRLPGIRTDERGYGYCVDCIFREADFFKYLDENRSFSDDPGNPNGNWYAFYLLAEVEYGLRSHYFEPYEYAAVVNEYVTKIKARYPKARFVLASPVGDFPDIFVPYYRELWESHLAPEVKDAITFSSLDMFYPPPALPDQKITVNKIINNEEVEVEYDAITDEQLISQANAFVDKVSAAGNAMFEITQKPVLLTQTGAQMYAAVDPAPNSLNFSIAGPCPWCQENDDVWRTVEYGTARLTQLIFSKLASSADETKVQAWAYWGNARQQHWQDPIIGKTWGDINHGVFWLSWPVICTVDIGCPVSTNQIWPSRVGMVYLKLAHNDSTFVPDDAPCWWPGSSNSRCL